MILAWMAAHKAKNREDLSRRVAEVLLVVFNYVFIIVMADMMIYVDHHYAFVLDFSVLTFPFWKMDDRTVTTSDDNSLDQKIVGQNNGLV